MSPSPTTSPSSLTLERREVQRIVTVLKKVNLGLADYHALGEQMRRLSEDPTVSRRGGHWRARVAELVGCSTSTLTKALQFRRAYEKEDLPALEELGVGWSRLTVSLAIANAQQRLLLLRKARDEKWGDREVQRAIQQQRGVRRGGGRPRKPPRSQGVLADLVELGRLTEIWQLYHERVTRAHQGEYPSQVRTLDEAGRQTLAQTVTEVQAQLKNLRRQVQEVRTVIDAITEHLQADGGSIKS